jgi:hypothetical protein
MMPLLFLFALDCAPCHAEIAASFAKTPMANSSGRVAGMAPAEFLHEPSQTRYTIGAGGTVKITTPEAKAQQRLDFFVGSGAHGRSYLFVRDRKLYQAPITLYAHKGWGASPGYERDKNSDWTRPVARECLWCHASGTRAIHGTVNTYAEPVFTHGGVACERCHASAAGHFNNPSKMSADARNDVCRQCHVLAGRRDLPGRSFFEYRPGMLLRELVTYETKPQSPETPLSTTSHFERLAASACAKASGDKLWCGSCHNPHPSAAADRNLSCLGCHSAQKGKRGGDCAGCHMPRNAAPDSGHAVFTDHWIR